MPHSWFSPTVVSPPGSMKRVEECPAASAIVAWDNRTVVTNHTQLSSVFVTLITKSTSHMAHSPGQLTSLLLHGARVSGYPALSGGAEGPLSLQTLTLSATLITLNKSLSQRVIFPCISLSLCVCFCLYCQLSISVCVCARTHAHLCLCVWVYNLGQQMQLKDLISTSILKCDTYNQASTYRLPPKAICSTFPQPNC